MSLVAYRFSEHGPFLRSPRLVAYLVLGTNPATAAAVSWTKTIFHLIVEVTILAH